MKKVKDDVRYGYAYVIGEHTADIINGRLYQLIETLGLKEQQEEAVKGFVKEIVWTNLSNGVFIGPKTHSKIMKQRDENRKTMAGYPESAVEI